jgi:asparagine synthase (glutamine-hydrolysing)
MSAAIAHRGPDGAGTWFSPTGGVGFAHRRLAIVDLSAAASQPMVDQEGRFCLVFNGEIYNHRQLRSELDALAPIPWRTDHSDTEVLLQAFRVWGAGCLDRLEGMFAFAIWDSADQELWLVRDRIGVKPVYFAVNNERLAFASEIKALLKDPAQPREVDEEALFHYLSFLVAPAPMTMYKGIRKLPAGSWLRLNRDGEVEVRRWWDPLDHVTAHAGMTEDEASGLVLSELRRAVELRKMADVPVGVFLSGGVDSSTNAVLFSEGEASAVRTFSVGYTGDALSYPSELPAAKEVAEALGADHHELVLGVDDLITFLAHMARTQDEPLADPVCFPLYHLGELARLSATPVVQVGEGADEIFAGYPRWHQMLQVQRWARRVPSGPLARRLVAANRSLIGRDTFRYEYARRAARGLPVFWGGAEGFGEDQKRELLSPNLRLRFSEASSWDVLAPLWQDFHEKSADHSDLSWMTYLDLRLRLPELILMRIDKMTMAWGVEARVPFLDHRLVTAVLGLPPAVRAGHQPKGLLKAAVRGIVPSSVLARPKQGFGVPLADWMQGPLGPVVASTLDRFCQESDLLDPGAVKRLLSGPRRTQAWYLFNLALWWQALGD